MSGLCDTCLVEHREIDGEIECTARLVRATSVLKCLDHRPRQCIHNDLAVGYRAGQADGCDRADGLLAKIIDGLAGNAVSFSSAAERDTFYDHVIAARAYLREKWLQK